MRVIAYYQRHTPNFQRRIGSLFSVLTNRGHSAFYQQATYLSQLKVSTYDAVILSDFAGIGSYDTLPEIPGQYIYDLSDATLYHDPSVRNILEQCAGVFVPSPGIKQTLSPHLKTVVQTSAIPTDILTTKMVTTPARPTVALLSPFDWTMILDPLTRFVREHDVQIVTDDPALCAALPPAKTALVSSPITTTDYVTLVRASYLTLLPGVSPLGDPTIALDFSYTGCPAIVSPMYAADLPAKSALVCRSENDWFTALDVYTRDDRKRAILAAEARQLCRKMTAPRVADMWWSRTRKFLAQ